MPRTSILPHATGIVTVLALACLAVAWPAPSHVANAASSSAKKSAPFGERLADAASAQRWVPVVYNPAYVKLKYPGGDVPWYTGVCTDVVVRAYRKLGIDLQVKVHRARVGSGDRNIDHRRVNVLRKFFARHGTSLPVTKNPENYKPGDLVTYYMPDGTFSKTHIAVVAKQKTASGRPMVIHNRGFGVQLENWLFAEKITGHYRYK
ncbi:MAG: DUF1287 domain-containing protein [Pseudomonadota bacterium]